MGKIIAVANQKGGVGKTTSTVNLAACVGQLRKKVLLIDIDPQGNATSGVGINKRAVEASSYDLLIGTAKAEDVILKTSFKNLSVIPSNIQLAGAEIELVDMEDRVNMLKKAIAAQKERFDYIFIDCPPSLGLVTRNAMVAADELIVPVIPNRSSLKGFTNIQKCVNSVRRNKRLNPNLRIAGIVVNMFDGRTSLSRGVVNELPSIARAANTKMFHTIIRKCEAVNKAQSANVSIFDYDPNCNAVADFTDFVNEYLEGEDY